MTIKAIQSTALLSPTGKAEVPLPQPTIEPNAVGRLPSALNILYFPFDLISTTSDLVKAKSVGDKEGEIDATLRLSTLPLNVLSSISGLATFLVQVSTITSYIRGVLFSIRISPNFLASLNIVGLILCFIESIVEGLAVKRQVELLSHFHLNTSDKIERYFTESDPEKKKKQLLAACHNLCCTKGLPLSNELLSSLKRLELTLLLSSSTSQELLDRADNLMHEANQQILCSDAEYLHSEFLTLSSSEKEKIERIGNRRFNSSSKEKIDQEVEASKIEMLTVKSNNLARRVAPWCAKEISSKLSPLLKQLKSVNPEVRKEAEIQLKELLSTTKTQVKKYLAYHIVSLIIFAASAAAYIALLSSCPPLIPILLLGGIGFISSASYLLHLGSINQRRWTFSISDCIPPLIKAIYERAKQFYNSDLSLKDRIIQQIESSAYLKKAYHAING